jgi:AcrR family transcriptional regulator
MLPQNPGRAPPLPRVRYILRAIRRCPATGGPIPRRSRPPGDSPSLPTRRAQIRRAAYVCFRDRGYHDTSVDDICHKASISKGSLYWHYTSKQEIFLDILDTWANEVMEELYRQFQVSLGQPDYLDAITTAIKREMRRGRIIVPMWLEFVLYARQEPEVQASLARFFRRLRAAVSEILTPMLGGTLSEGELRGVAAVIFGAYTGLLLQEMSDRKAADAGRNIEEFMAVLGRWLTSLQQVPRIPAAEARSEAIPRRRHGTPRGAGRRVTRAVLDTFLAGSEPAVRDRFFTLRDLVLAEAPDADERVISGWSMVAWGHRHLFCSIQPRRGEVRVGFARGADLPDPGALLEGRGHRSRYVCVPAEGAFDVDALAALVRAAAGQA